LNRKILIVIIITQIKKSSMSNKENNLITAVGALIKQTDKTNKLLEVGLVQSMKPTEKEKKELKEINKTLKELKEVSKKKSEYEYEVEINSELKKELKGDTPTKGVDYFTPKERVEFKDDIQSEILPEIKKDFSKREDEIKKNVKKTSEIVAKKEIEETPGEDFARKLENIREEQKRLSFRALKDVPAKFKKGNKGGADGFFINLSDTPDNYIGAGLDIVRVKQDEKGLEFVDRNDIYFNNVIFVKNTGSGHDIQDVIDSEVCSIGNPIILVLDGGFFNEDVVIDNKDCIDITAFGSISTFVKSITIKQTNASPQSNIISNIFWLGVSVEQDTIGVQKLFRVEDCQITGTFNQTGTDNQFHQLAIKNSLVSSTSIMEGIFISSEHTALGTDFTINGDTVFQHSSGELNGSFTLNDTTQAFIRNDGIHAFPLLVDVDIIINNSAILNIDSQSYATANITNNTGTEASVQLLEGTNAGVISPSPVITDQGGGVIDIAEGQCFIYDNDHQFGLPRRFIVPAQTGITLTDNATNYILINYNSGSPIYQVSLTNTSNESNIIPVANYFREGSILHDFSWDSIGEGLSNKIHQRILGTEPFAHGSGLAIGEDTGRIVTITAGSGYNGAVPISFDEFRSDTDSHDFVALVGGVWTKNPAGLTTQYNNTQYQGATDLVNAVPNKYLVNFYFRGLEEDAHAYYALGTQEYPGTAAGLIAAELAQVPADLPKIITEHTFLVGKIIVLTNAATATSIQSAFIQQFSANPTTDHLALSNLNGGDGVGNHTNAFNLQGRSLGQTAYGGIATGEGFTMYSNPSKDGVINLGDCYYLDEALCRIGVKYDSPTERLTIGYGDIDFIQVPSPTTAPSGTAVSGSGLEIGDYKYRISYVNDSGETELSTVASATITTTAGNQQIDLTSIPISPTPTVIARKIHRTKVGGSLYYYVATINDNTTTIYSDTTPDASLTIRTDPQGNSTAGTIKLDGSNALVVNTVNTILGYDAGSNLLPSARYNFFGGSFAGRDNEVGNNNTYLGIFSGRDATGSSNTYVGFSCGVQCTVGSGNTGFGESTFFSANVGSLNTSMGRRNLYFATAANNNSTFGYYSGRLITTGDGNSLFGYQTGDNLTTGSYNIIIGYDLNASASNVNYELNIGDTIKGSLSTNIAGFVGGMELTERSSDPADPAEGKSVMWQSDGTGSGDDGDILLKITAGGTTKTATLVDFSAI
jgi:hypothetical protein